MDQLPLGCPPQYSGARPKPKKILRDYAFPQQSIPSSSPPLLVSLFFPPQFLSFCCGGGADRGKTFSFCRGHNFVHRSERERRKGEKIAEQMIRYVAHDFFSSVRLRNLSITELQHAVNHLAVARVYRMKGEREGIYFQTL